MASTGFVLIMQYAIRKIQFVSLEDAILTYLPLLICYVSVFVLPEQIVITYCKIRFKAFNYNSRGYLHDIEKIELKGKMFSLYNGMMNGGTNSNSFKIILLTIRAR